MSDATDGTVNRKMSDTPHLDLLCYTKAQEALDWIQSDEGMRVINESQQRAAATARKLRVALGRTRRGDQKGNDQMEQEPVTSMTTDVTERFVLHDTALLQHAKAKAIKLAVENSVGKSWMLTSDGYSLAFNRVKPRS